MYSFSSLVNCTTLNELVKRLCLLKVLYCSEMESVDTRKAYNCIVRIINLLNKETLTLPHENDYCNTEEILNDLSDYDNDSLHVQPFGAYFQLKVAKVSLTSQEKCKNIYYQPHFFLTIIEKWMPLAPFWTCLMLGKI